MPPKKKSDSPKQIESIAHEEATRKNIPTAEYQSVMGEEDRRPLRVAYERRNADLDPQLVWRGKDVLDWSDLVVDAPPLYIQEKIKPKALVDDLLRRSRESQDEQLDLFADFDGLPDSVVGTEFYRHDAHWSNRMILGDALQVMASLAEREGLRGKVQCIYLDPPYGIKFNSNFQWSTTSRDVKDGKVEHITREPEQVKAFRDTWREGIHSYLTYLRDRLTVARDLLSDSGSIFVQIGDENVHRVRALMDEVFGEDNYVSQITVRKTTSEGSRLLGSTCDFILWYSKKQDIAKFRVVYSTRNSDAEKRYSSQYLDGSFYRLDNITSSRPAGDGDVTKFSFIGLKFNPGKGTFKTTLNGLKNLARSDRFQSTKAKKLNYRRFQNDFGYSPISNLWSDISGAVQSRSDPKIYVVQSSTSMIERCILMTTDPGDLVLDPTCLRQGTKILTPTPSPDRGRAGEGANPVAQNTINPTVSSPLNPPVNGGTLRSVAVSSPLNPPARGGTLRSGAVETLSAIAIENLRPGNWVIGHDGQPHQVIRTIAKPYQGRMIGIRHRQNNTWLWVTAEHRILCQRRNLDYGGQTSWNHIPGHHFDRAKTLRKNQTTAEQKLWQTLRREQLGAKFRRQHPIGAYIVDFYARDKGIVIEVDGESHDRPEAQAYDAARDRYLQSLGLTVLRFTNDQVYHNLEGVIDRIQAHLETTEASDQCDRQWRRADSLEIGDVVFFGLEQKPIEICQIVTEQTEEIVYDLEVEGVHSFVTETCTVHNCGSGTTAYVAEQWGRRWITIDTSRVALALARIRIMGARYPYYLLKDTPAGQQKEAELSQTPASNAPTHRNIRQGFVYQRVPHITLKAIANNTEIDVIWEKYQPKIEQEIKAKVMI